MRPIKFRAWNKEMKYMISPEIIGEWRIESLMDSIKISHYEFMQFTGVLDKNGKEIYEGDIVKFEYDLNPPEICKIIWEDESARFRPKGWCHGPVGAWVAFNKIVIGNICENPELLKGEGE